MRYKFIEDLVSDVMFEAYGKDLAELLQNAGLALFSVVCQIDKIKPKKSIKLKVKGKDEGDLLFTFLTTLLSEAELKELFLCKFDVKIKKNKGYIAEITAYGEPISPEKGETVVKGVTYYKFKVEKIKKGYKARVACDI